ncbi:hypothetical protein [Clostridium sp. D53t1_180928_C8]|uniref:hypothetical protein n=1 Tax=Clostridium sp. D53t1_180928_C8 TaxID=2787101 RepID=UPI0018ABC302|nr:hypothetical protein [Clostridium sp. D53t1_180928_C8]
MKKLWQEPKLKALGIAETKDITEEVRYTTQSSQHSLKQRYLCLGVYQKGTNIKVADCPNPGPYSSFGNWAVHADIDHKDLQIGEKVEVTPVS